MDLTSSNYDNFMAAATFHPLGALSDPDRKVFIKRRADEIDVSVYHDVARVFIDDEGDMIIEAGDFTRTEADDD